MRASKCSPHVIPNPLLQACADVMTLFITSLLLLLAALCEGGLNTQVPPSRHQGAVPQGCMERDVDDSGTHFPRISA